MNQADLQARWPQILSDVLDGGEFPQGCDRWFLSYEERKKLSADGQQSLMRSRLRIYTVYCAEGDCSKTWRQRVNPEHDVFYCDDHGGTGGDYLPPVPVPSAYELTPEGLEEVGA